MMCGYYDTCILNTGISDSVWSTSCHLQLYLQGKAPNTDFERRLSGALSLLGCGGEQKISDIPAGNKTSAVQSITDHLLTDLSCFCNLHYNEDHSEASNQ
jgi:hypothetical protein